MSTNVDEETMREWTMRQAKSTSEVWESSGRHSIVCDASLLAEYFHEGMTEIEVLAMKRYLISCGKARWTWPDLR